MFIDEAKKILGDDFLNNYYLDDSFDLTALDNSHLMQRNDQKLHLPLSNETFKKLITIQKKPFNEIYAFNSRGKNIHGIYLIAKDDKTNKKILFSLSIIKTIENNLDNLDFSIKLDMCIKGKEWVNILRLDSLGNTHLNYITNGKVAKSKDEIELAPTPHLHYNSYETQVIIDNLDYTLAKHIPELNFENLSSLDKNIFKKCFNYFVKVANINIQINKKIEEDYKYDCINTLWDYDKIPQVEHLGEL